MTGSSVRRLSGIGFLTVVITSIPAWGVCPGPNDCFRGPNCDQYLGDGTTCTVDACGHGGNGLCGSVLGNPVKQCRRQPGQDSCPTVACHTATCPLPPGCDFPGQCIGQGTCQQNPAPGQSCDDGNVCTTNDTCDGNLVCVGTPTVGNVCRAAVGVCDVAETCTGGACPPDGFQGPSTVCRPSAGACDVAETCSGTSADCPPDGFAPSTTVCRPAAGECDVAERCTGTEAGCPPDTHAPPGRPRGHQAASACHAPDSANAAGICAANPVAPGTACESDGNPCTDDVCDGMGTCKHPTNAACGGGGGGSVCTQSVTCGGGSCPGSNPVSCAPADPCHEAGTCDPQSGRCIRAPKPDGSSCDDGNACTATDSCTGGVCSGRAVSCDDGDPCTEDRCDPAGGCVHPPAPDGSPCDDGNACTTKDSCTAGTCRGQAVSCDDGDPCTEDRCDATAGCVHPPAPNGAPCDDGQVCTADDRCLGGRCESSTFTCGRVDTKSEVSERGDNPVLKVTCATTDDAGGSAKGECQATGFLASDAEASAVAGMRRPTISGRAAAFVEAEDSSGAHTDDAVAPARVALGDVAPDTQVTRGTVRRALGRRGRATLKLALNSTGRRLLKESGSLRVRLQVDVTDRTGRSTTLQFLVSLLRKRR